MQSEPKISILEEPTITEAIQRDVMQKLHSIRKALEAEGVSGVIVQVQITSDQFGFELRFPLKVP